MSPHEPDQILDLLTDFPTTPLSKLLERAVALSQRIHNPNLETWAKLGLNGYFEHNPEMTEEVAVPAYRTVPGQWEDGWGRPLIIRNPKLQFASQQRLRQGVAELERLCSSTNLITIRDPNGVQILKQHLGVEVDHFSFLPSSLETVLTSIRSELLTRLNALEPKAAAAETTAATEKPQDMRSIHPAVRRAAAKLVKTGHFRQAILDTYISLIAAVKEKSAVSDKDGSALMQTVFSQKDPILRVSEDPDEQLGYMWLFSGAAMAIRNPLSHRVDEHPPTDRTMELLAFAPYLFHTLDRSKRVPHP